MVHNPDASIVYLGRLSVTLPAKSTVQINGADYDGVQISEPGPSASPADPVSMARSMDEQWKAHVKKVDESFGPGTPLVLNRNPVEGQRAFLYRAMPGTTLGAQDKVIQEIWTAVDGHEISLSIQGYNSEQPATRAVLTRVLHALGPQAGPIGPDVFAAPGCYIHLPPATGESIQAVVNFGPGYDLTLSTDVFRHLHPPDVQQRLRSGSIPVAGFQQIQSGSASAGPLRGEQAAVRMKVGSSVGYIAEFGFAGVDGGDSLQPTTSLRLTADERTAGITETSFLATWRSVLAGFAVRTGRNR